MHGTRLSLSGISWSVRVGDIAVFHNMGAYTLVFKPPFIRPNPPIVGYDATSAEFTLLRREETADDVFATILSRRGKPMNVLLTCAGRRNYLINAFQEALQGRGRVFAADCLLEAPALQEADQGFLLPSVTDAGYDRELLRLCREQQIGLLIPLNDLELPRLATLTAALSTSGTLAVVSSPEVIQRCSDKLPRPIF